MSKDHTLLLDSFTQGIIDAVESFEKNSEFQVWMQNDRFREKLASRLEDKIKQVRENPADEQR